MCVRFEANKICFLSLNWHTKWIFFVQISFLIDFYFWIWIQFFVKISKNKKASSFKTITNWFKNEILVLAFCFLRLFYQSFTVYIHLFKKKSNKIEIFYHSNLDKSFVYVIFLNKETNGDYIFNYSPKV